MQKNRYHHHTPTEEPEIAHPQMAEIRFAAAPCSLGFVGVAVGDHGVCAIEFADDAAALTTSLRARFPDSVMVDDPVGLAGALTSVVALVEDPSSRIDLRLDPGGTPFQRTVWDALCEIPPGETRTYTEVANLIGRPTAARAVATACASNRIAIAIPCHRVVRAGGALSGYRWGAERKRCLLDREKRQ